MKHEIAILVLEDFLSGQRDQLARAKNFAAVASSNEKQALFKLKAVQNLEKGIKEVEESIVFLKSAK